MTNSGTIRITARTLDLAREALAAWVAENPRRALAKPVVTHGWRAQEDCHWLMIPTPCVGSVANFAPLRVNALRRSVANACRQRGTRG